MLQLLDKCRRQTMPPLGRACGLWSRYYECLGGMSYDGMGVSTIGAVLAPSEVSSQRLPLLFFRDSSGSAVPLPLGPCFNASGYPLVQAHSDESA